MWLAVGRTSFYSSIIGQPLASSSESPTVANGPVVIDSAVQLWQLETLRHYWLSPITSHISCTAKTSIFNQYLHSECTWCVLWHLWRLASASPRASGHWHWPDVNSASLLELYLHYDVFWLYARSMGNWETAYAFYIYTGTNGRSKQPYDKVLTSLKIRLSSCRMATFFSRFVIYGVVVNWIYFIFYSPRMVEDTG